MTDHKLPSSRRLANDDCNGGIVDEGFGLSIGGWRHHLRRDGCESSSTVATAVH